MASNDSCSELEILKKKLDKNGDCKISQEEFAAVLCQKGLRFGKWRAWYAVHSSDTNGDHFIKGDIEIAKLLELVKKKYPWILSD